MAADPPSGKRAPKRDLPNNHSEGSNKRNKTEGEGDSPHRPTDPPKSDDLDPGSGISQGTGASAQESGANEKNGAPNQNSAVSLEDSSTVPGSGLHQRTEMESRTYGR